MPSQPRLTKWFDRVVVPICVLAVIVGVVMIAVGPSGRVWLGQMIGLLAVGIAFGLNFALRGPVRRK